MKGQLTSVALIFVISLIIVVILFGTAFGKAVVGTALQGFAALAPSFVQEEIASFASAAALAPGDAEFSLRISATHYIEFNTTEDGHAFVWVTPEIYQKPEEVYVAPPGVAFFAYGSNNVTPAKFRLSGDPQLLTVKKTGGNITLEAINLGGSE
jgi:hypothetical protein